MELVCNLQSKMDPVKMEWKAHHNKQLSTGRKVMDWNSRNLMVVSILCRNLQQNVDFALTCEITVAFPFLEIHFPFLETAFPSLDLFPKWNCPTVCPSVPLVCPTDICLTLPWGRDGKQLNLVDFRVSRLWDTNATDTPIPYLPR